ncbi:MAG: hypothetical protein KGL09_02020 [Pseudomonadota bacterium]|nr:hypothetical protein [Pseudomonadota bacterium]MDE3140570.1 hypothetical protein [Pseudomonadota bacterium]
MKRHHIAFRVTDAEHANLKSAAAAAGMTVPVLARLRCLQNLEIEPRLAAIERAIAAVPTAEKLLVALRHLEAKIDRAGGSK